jgi:hypothetical protein
MSVFARQSCPLAWFSHHPPLVDQLRFHRAPDFPARCKARGDVRDALPWPELHRGRENLHPDAPLVFVGGPNDFRGKPM